LRFGKFKNATSQRLGAPLCCICSPWAMMNHDQVNGFLAAKIDFHRVILPTWLPWQIFSHHHDFEQNLKSIQMFNQSLQFDKLKIK
jgi:hypothetical protein